MCVFCVCARARVWRIHTSVWYILARQTDSDLRFVCVCEREARGRIMVIKRSCECSDRLFRGSDKNRSVGQKMEGECESEC